MGRRLLAAVSVVGLVLLAACGPTKTGPTGTSPTATSPTRSIAGAPPATEPTGPTVADYFSAPRRYPGPTWTKAGRAVTSRELSSSAGPEHCDWQTAVMLYVGWPLGTVSQTSDEVLQFIRDPNGVIVQNLHGTLALHVSLPADARDTGYRTGPIELWLSASQPDSAFLRRGHDVERWPRADPVVACE